ncbi:hypothetical protein DFQ26_008099 [Actinomortierella ambigua]|nr:hypothetical protein DFQ26_008099 [Actinomortierella ambigua]
MVVVKFGDHPDTKKQRMLPPSPPPELNPFNAPTVLAIERMFDRVVELAKKPPSSSKVSSTPSTSSSSLLTGRPVTVHPVSKPQRNDTIAAFQPKEAQQRQQAFSSDLVRVHSKASAEGSGSSHKYRFLHPPLLNVDTAEVPPQSSTQLATTVEPSPTSEATAPSSLQSGPCLPPLHTPSQTQVSLVVSETPRIAAPSASIPVGSGTAPTLVELIDSDEEDEEVEYDSEDGEESEVERAEQEEEEELWIEDDEDDEDHDDEHELEDDIVYQDLGSEVDDGDEDDDEELEEDARHGMQRPIQTQVVELLSSDDEPIEGLEQEEVEEAEEDELVPEEEDDQIEGAQVEGAAFIGSIQMVDDSFTGFNRGGSVLDEASEGEDVEDVEEVEEGGYDSEEEDVAEGIQVVDIDEEDEPLVSDISDGDVSSEQYTRAPVSAVTVPPSHVYAVEETAEVTPSPIAEEFEGGSHDEPSPTECDEDDAEDKIDGGAYTEDDQGERWTVQRSDACDQEDDVYTLEEEEEEEELSKVVEDADKEEEQLEAMEDEDEVEEVMDIGSPYSEPDSTFFPTHSASRLDSSSVMSDHESEGEGEEEQEEEASPEPQEQNEGQRVFPHFPTMQDTYPTMRHHSTSEEPEVAIVLDDSDQEEVIEDEQMEVFSAAEDDSNDQEDAEQVEEEEDEDETGGILNQDDSSQDSYGHLRGDESATILATGFAQGNGEELQGDMVTPSTAILDGTCVLLEPEVNPMLIERLPEDEAHFEQLEAAYMQVQEEERENGKDGEVTGKSAAVAEESVFPPVLESGSTLLSQVADTIGISPAPGLEGSQDIILSGAVTASEEEGGATPARSPFKARLARTGTMVQTIRDGNLFLQHLDARAIRDRSSPAIPTTSTIGLLSTPDDSVMAPPSIAAVGDERSTDTVQPWLAGSQQEEEHEDLDMEGIQQVDVHEGNVSIETVSTSQDVADSDVQSGSPSPSIPALPTATTTTTTTTTTAVAATPAKPMLQREMMQLVKEAREFCQSSPSNAHLGEMGGSEGPISTMAIRRAISARAFNRRRGSAHSDQQDAASLVAEAGQGGPAGAEQPTSDGGGGSLDGFSEEHLIMQPSGPPSSILSPSVSASSTATVTVSLSSASASSSGVVDLAAERVIKSTLVGNHALRTFIHPPVSPIRSSPVRFSPSSASSSSVGSKMAVGHGSRSGSVERTMSMSVSPLGSGYVIPSAAMTGAASGFGPPPQLPFPTTKTATASANQAAAAALSISSPSSAASASTLPSTMNTMQPISPFQFGTAVAGSAAALATSESRPLEVGFTFGTQAFVNSTTSSAAAAAAFDEHTSQEGDNAEDMLEKD